MSRASSSEYLRRVVRSRKPAGTSCQSRLRCETSASHSSTPCHGWPLKLNETFPFSSGLTFSSAGSAGFSGFSGRRTGVLSSFLSFDFSSPLFSSGFLSLFSPSGFFSPSAGFSPSGFFAASGVALAEDGCASVVVTVTVGAATAGESARDGDAKQPTAIKTKRLADRDSSPVAQRRRSGLTLDSPFTVNSPRKLCSAGIVRNRTRTLDSCGPPANSGGDGKCT